MYPPQVISNWERKYTDPDYDDILRLSDALDCSADYLLGRTDAPADKQSRDLAKQFPILADIDPELLQKFAEAVREDPYQSLFFDDILSADREEREQIVREWLELRRKYKDKKKDEPPEDDGPSAWDIIRNKKQ